MGGIVDKRDKNDYGKSTYNIRGGALRGGIRLRPVARVRRGPANRWTKALGMSLNRTSFGSRAAIARGVSRLHAECGLGEQMISKVNWKSNSIIMTIGVCVVFHLFVSLVSGIMVGYARSDLVGDRSKVPGTVIKSTERTRQWLENETNDAIRFWYPVYHFSQHYPIGWILTPITKKIGRGILKEYMDERNLSSDQVRFRVQAIAVAKTLINSFFFGFSLFLSWYVVHKTRKKNNRK